MIATLEVGLRKDRTRTTIQSFSALGLLEFTRKRIGKDLSAQLRGPCPTCSGLGSVMSAETVAIDAFRDLRDFGHTHAPGNGRGAAKRSDSQAIEVHVAPTVAAELEFWYEDEMTNLRGGIGNPRRRGGRCSPAPGENDREPCSDLKRRHQTEVARWAARRRRTRSRPLAGQVARPDLRGCGGR